MKMHKEEIPNDYWRLNNNNKCFTCSQPIRDRFSIILNSISKDDNNPEKGSITDENFKFHEACLTCSQCHRGLAFDVDRNCYLTNNGTFILCYECRNRERSCSKCNQIIHRDSWIYRLDRILYHLSCFSCSLCQRQICQGEKCYVNQSILYCSSHIPQKFSHHNITNLHNDVVNADQGRLAFTYENKEPGSEVCFSEIKKITNPDHIIGSYFGLINIDGKHLSSDQINPLITDETKEKKSLLESDVEKTDMVFDELDSDPKSFLSDFHISPEDSFNLTGQASMADNRSEDSNSTSRIKNNNGTNQSFNHNKLKRVRTSFTPDQLVLLQASFEMEANPDGQELERIANSAKLNKRVTQVWFQNARARKKKTQKTLTPFDEQYLKSPVNMSCMNGHQDTTGQKRNSINSSDSSELSGYYQLGQQFDSTSPDFIKWSSNNKNISSEN